MSFDETNIKRIDIDRAFKAGAQSQQAEIDKLKQALKTSLAAHECVCLERDELQERIDEALRFYNEAKSPHNIGMIQMAILLKGNKDEN